MEVTTTTKSVAGAGQRGASGQDGAQGGDASAFLLALIGAQLGAVPAQAAAPSAAPQQQGGAEGQPQLFAALAGVSAPSVPVAAPALSQGVAVRAGMEAQPNPAAAAPAATGTTPVPAPLQAQGTAAPGQAVAAPGPEGITVPAAPTPSAASVAAGEGTPAPATAAVPAPAAQAPVAPAPRETADAPVMAPEGVKVTVADVAAPVAGQTVRPPQAAPAQEPARPSAPQEAVEAETIPHAQQAETQQPTKAQDSGRTRREGGNAVTPANAATVDGESPEVEAASGADLGGTSGGGSEPGTPGRAAQPSPLGLSLRPFGAAFLDGYAAGALPGTQSLQAQQQTQHAAAAEVRAHDAAPQAKEIAGQVAEALVRGQAKDGGRIVVDLNPASLGRVEVIIEKGEHGARARVLVERSETLSAIQADSRALERSLADAGIDLSQGGMTFGYRDRQEYRERLESLAAERSQFASATPIRRTPVPVTSSSGGIDIIV